MFNYSIKKCNQGWSMQYTSVLLVLNEGWSTTLLSLYEALGSKFWVMHHKLQGVLGQYFLPLWRKQEQWKLKTQNGKECKLAMPSAASRFSLIHGKPLIRNFLSLLACIACCRSLSTTLGGTNFPSFLNCSIIFLHRSN